MTEILAPAGDEITAKRALLAGADAVYLGLKSFSARSGAENLDLNALRRTTDFAHLLKKKIYLCLNTLIKDGETEEFFRLAVAGTESGADALIVQDMFLGKALKEACPELCLHLSTQAGCCNVLGALLAKECGFSRVVLSRETAFEDIRAISEIIETEVFVQGALCSGFSGQCYFSSFVGNNSGNRGKCKQPCRKKYAIDRKGYESFAYALSPADLCLGRRIKELERANVASFKIEGRMRRSEYVAAAVNYYRALLKGEKAEEAFSDLKRAYNRGDYTEGLAFSKDKFLSRNVQGHIGERVGFLEKNAFCKSCYAANPKDGFKILRNGKEVGGAVYLKPGTGGFFLSSSETLRVGDEVRLTTDSTLSARLKVRRRKISLSIFFCAEQPVRILAEGFEFRGAAPERAQKTPVTESVLRECFLKTNEDAFEVCFTEIVCENAFLPMSALNEMRRNFYRELKEFLLPHPPVLSLKKPQCKILPGIEQKTAIISLDGSEKADILIFKPACYADFVIPRTKGELYLYLPPFFTGSEIAAVEPNLSQFGGIYSNGYYALLLAKKHGLRFFAGTGWNLTNEFSVSQAQKLCDFYTVSKELNALEQSALCGKGAFVLKGGAIKLMDLCYCPFEKSCSECDKRNFYTLKDESGREFPLRRYRAEDCRFELFNCNPLAENPCRAGEIFDKTVEILAPQTKGHLIRSML